MEAVAKTTVKKDVSKKRVLVLNKHWQAIGTTSLERGLAKVFSTYKCGEPKAKIVDWTNFQAMNWSDWSAIKPKDDEDAIVSVNDIFRMPKIIQLTRYDKVPSRTIRFSRRAIFKRDEGKCQYCSCKLTSEEATLDHVIPKSFGGKTNWENIALACVSCNVKKRNRRPEEAGMKLLTKPKKPKFSVLMDQDESKMWSTWISEAYWNVELENEN